MLRTSALLVTLFVCLLFAGHTGSQPLPNPPGTVAAASFISVDTSSMTNCNSATEDTVQECLEALDAVAGGGGGGSAIILDLADDDVNESTDLVEIAIGTDANSIFTEPSPNKLLINPALPWASASALSTNPGDCASGLAARGITANGTAESCFDVFTQAEADAQTEASLEADLTDVTNVFTNLDGALTDDDLSDNTADQLPYTPTTPGDWTAWTTAPTQVLQALDRIATQIAALFADTGIPGLSRDGICRDECRQWMQSRITDGTETFPLPSRVYFFSTNTGGNIPTVGVDTNNGTFESPLLTLDKCNEILAAGGICALDGGAADAWDTRAEWGTGAATACGAGYENTAFCFQDECAAGAFCGGVIGWGDERAIIDAGGLDPAFDPDGAGTANAAGDVSDGVVRIGDTVGVGHLLANLDFVGLPPTNNKNQDIVRYDNTSAAYSTLLMWNVRADGLQGENNQLYTSHGDKKQAFIFGGGGTLINDASTDGNFNVIQPVNPNNYTVIWGGEYIDAQEMTGNGLASVMTFSPANLTTPLQRYGIFDTSIRSTGADDSQRHNAIVSTVNATGADIEIFLDNVFIHGYDQTHAQGLATAIRPVSTTSTTFTIDTRVYRTTVAETLSFFYMNSQPGSTSINLYGRCNNLVGVTDRVFAIAGAAGTCDNNDVDMASSTYDEGVSAQEFRIEAENHTTAAAAAADSVTEGCNGGAGYTNLFPEAGLESSATIEFAGLDALGICTPGGACFEACTLSDIPDYQFTNGAVPEWLARFVFGDGVTFSGFGPASGTGHLGRNF